MFKFRISDLPGSRARRDAWQKTRPSPMGRMCALGSKDPSCSFLPIAVTPVWPRNTKNLTPSPFSHLTLCGHGAKIASKWYSRKDMVDGCRLSVVGCRKIGPPIVGANNHSPAHLQHGFHGFTPISDLQLQFSTTKNAKSPARPAAATKTSSLAKTQRTPRRQEGNAVNLRDLGVFAQDIIRQVCVAYVE